VKDVSIIMMLHMVIEEWQRSACPPAGPVLTSCCTRNRNWNHYERMCQSFKKYG